MSHDTCGALLRYQQDRKQSICLRLADARQQIEKEIDANYGVYPFNGGRLSTAEVCRRANVAKITLHGAAHRESTKPELQDWLVRIKKAMVIGKASVRRAVTDRAAYWEDRYLKSVQWVDQYHRQEAATRRSIEAMKTQIDTLTGENRRLKASLAGDNVVHLMRRDDPPSDR